MAYNPFEEPFQPARNAYDWSQNKARQIAPIYGSPPSGVSREQAASEDAAKRFARRRMLSGLAAGFGKYNPGGGFVENLFRGFSGSLGGTLQANQMQHEEERQAIRDAADRQRQANEDAYRQRTEQRAIGAEARAIEDQNWQRVDRARPDRSGYQALPWWLSPGVDPELRAKAQADEFRAPQGRQPTEWEQFKGMSDAERKDYEDFRRLFGGGKLREDVADRLDIINQMDPHNPEHATRLEGILKNPATKEEYEAAKRKLEVSSRPGAYWYTPAPKK